MTEPLYQQFSSEYPGHKATWCVTGRFMKLKGAALDDWRADYMLVVYFRYYVKDGDQHSGPERCVYISFSNGISRVISVSGSEDRNTAFYEWLTGVVTRHVKAEYCHNLNSSQQVLFPLS